MPLPWEATSRLMRLLGMTEELLASYRTGADGPLPSAGPLQVIVDEAQQILSLSDEALAREFERVALGAAEKSGRPDLEVAAVAGWLKAMLGTQAMDAQRSAAPEPPPEGEQRRRKQTIGFKLRSPITREPEAAAAATESSDDES